MTAIHPFLAVRDVDAAVELYGRAFGAELMGSVLRAPDGAAVAEMSIDGCAFGIATEAPQLKTPSPETVGATTVRVSLVVSDPDAVVDRAVEAGCELMFPVADQPYGWRQGRVVDPFGHHWLVGRPL